MQSKITNNSGAATGNGLTSSSGGVATARHILSVREKTRPYFAGWVDHLTPYFCSDPRFAKKYLYRLTNEHDRDRLIFLGYEVMEGEVI